jgi:hypothetical protein
VVKRPGREFDHSHRLIPRLIWRVFKDHSLYFSMAWCLVQQRDGCAFCYTADFTKIVKLQKLGVMLQSRFWEGRNELTADVMKFQ